MLSARRPGRAVVAVAAVTMSAALVVSCSADSPPQAEGAEHGAGVAPAEQAGKEPARTTTPEKQVRLELGNQRASRGVVAAGGADAAYNYGPTVMVDGGATRMWWCSQYGSAPPAGDDILHAQAPSPDGPFRSPGGGMPAAVLSGNTGEFDAVHTCDPSVIRVDGTYYMYYTGAAGSHALGNAIGLATSTDGVHWKRPVKGPVVTPAHDRRRANTYGAGQPAAVYLDGWFYLMFTDTTARAAGWNGAGQFLLRAKDPTFAAGVEALGPNGFVPVHSTAAERTSSLVDAFSADLMWVDALSAFAIAHQTDRGTSITFWNRGFSATPYRPVLIESTWREGPGLVRQPDGHAPVSATDPCGRVPIDVIHATVTGRANAPTALRRFGVDVRDIDACAEPARALAVLDGFAVPSPVRTMDLVVDGKVVRIERRSVAAGLAAHVLDQRPSALDKIPVAARLAPGAKTVRAPGVGVGFVLDGGWLWPVRKPEVVARNDSTAAPISRPEWDSYPVGPTLG